MVHMRHESQQKNEVKIVYGKVQADTPSSITKGPQQLCQHEASKTSNMRAYDVKLINTAGKIYELGQALTVTRTRQFRILCLQLDRVPGHRVRRQGVINFLLGAIFVCLCRTHDVF